MDRSTVWVSCFQRLSLFTDEFSWWNRTNLISIMIISRSIQYEIEKTRFSIAWALVWKSKESKNRKEQKLLLSYLRLLKHLQQKNNHSKFVNFIQHLDQFLNKVILGWVYELNSNREKCTQPAITCSKLTIETVEQGVKYVQS